MFRGPKKNKGDKSKNQNKRGKSDFVISAPPAPPEEEGELANDAVVEFITTEKAFAESMHIYIEALRDLEGEKEIFHDAQSKQHFTKFLDLWEQTTDAHKRYLQSYEENGLSDETLRIFEEEFGPALSETAVLATFIMENKIDGNIEKRLLNRRISDTEKEYRITNPHYKALNDTDSYSIKPMQHLSRYPMKLVELAKNYRQIEISEELSGAEILKLRVANKEKAKSADKMLVIAGKMATDANEKVRAQMDSLEKRKKLSTSEELSRAVAQDLLRSVSFMKSTSQEMSVAKKPAKEHSLDSSQREMPKYGSIRRKEKKPETKRERQLEQRDDSPEIKSKHHPLLSAEGLHPAKRKSLIVSQDVERKSLSTAQVIKPLKLEKGEKEKEKEEKKKSKRHKNK